MCGPEAGRESFQCHAVFDNADPILQDRVGVVTVQLYLCRQPYWARAIAFAAGK